jgi:hypothetical protein
MLFRKKRKYSYRVLLHNCANYRIDADDLIVTYADTPNDDNVPPGQILDYNFINPTGEVPVNPIPANALQAIFEIKK